MEVIQYESLKPSDRRNNDDDNNLENKRRLLLEILKQRKILTDSETGELINDDTNIRTLKIIQREKEGEKDKETVKIKELPEAFFRTDRFTGINPLMYYSIPYNLWYRGYCSARDLISEQTMICLLLLAINPLTGWFFHPFLFGWTQ